MVSTPLKNMKVNRKDDNPYIMDNKQCVKPPTSIIQTTNIYNILRYNEKITNGHLVVEPPVSPYHLGKNEEHVPKQWLTNGDPQ